MKRKSKKTAIILTIVIIVTAVCIAAGVLLHYGGTILGKVEIAGTDKEIVTKEEKLEAFNSVSANIAIADLIIEEGEEYSVSYNLPQEYLPVIQVKDQVLYLEGNSDKLFLGVGKDRYQICVTIPKNKEQESISCEVGTGNLEIYDAQCKQITLNVGTGSIACERVKAGTLDLHADCGNVELHDMIFTSGSCSVNVGNVEVEGDFQKLEANSSLGNIEVNTTVPDSEPELDLDVGVGNIDVNGKEYKE